MANIKISELTELSMIENDDYLPVVDTSADETKKIKVQNLIKNNLEGKFIFIGDSYATRSDNWVDPLIEKLGLGVNDYYKGVLGSTGFVRDVSGTTFITLLQNVVSNLSSEEKLNITHVVVCGGANDTLINKSLIAAAIANFVNYVNNNLPNAKTYIGEIGWTSNSANIAKYLDVVIEYSKCNLNANCFYLNNVHYTLQDISLIGSDEVHPTADGCELLAANIYSCLKQGSSNTIKGIVESGSNSNGQWIKYEDGTMICRYKQNLGEIATTTTFGSVYWSNTVHEWTFPQEFYSEPEYVNMVPYTTSISGCNLQSAPTKTKATCFLYSFTSGTRQTYIYWVAIGKWK